MPIMTVPMRKLFPFILLMVSACVSTPTTWNHPTASQQQRQNILDQCWASANQQSPVYICRNPMMCAPEESGLVFNSINARERAYEMCMFQNGFTKG